MRDAANAHEEMAAQRETLTANNEYLMDLRNKCAAQDKLFSEKKTARAAEAEAISKALAVRFLHGVCRASGW